MDEQEFKTRSTMALESLQRKLSAASDEHDFESDFNAGALSIEFEDPKTRFVVSPNTPVRQIWVSAHSKSFKLGWDAKKDEFILPDTGQSLDELIASAISAQVGEKVRL
jgi:iron donor protein CyaY